MYRHLVNEITDLHLVIISNLALVIFGPLSSDQQSSNSTDLFENQVNNNKYNPVLTSLVPVLYLFLYFGLE